MKKSRKGAMEIEEMAWIALGVALLVLLGFGVWVMSGRGSGALEFIKNLFRFGGAG